MEYKVYAKVYHWEYVIVKAADEEDAIKKAEYIDPCLFTEESGLYREITEANEVIH